MSPSPLVDAFARRIDYLRISVTDRCNFRCVYCMPEAGFPALPKSHQLRPDELTRLIEIAASLGMRKVRFTGGEPLLRRELPEWVAVARKAGYHDISVTTNGHLLSEMAADLAAAGLDRINVSLDTLRPERFKAISRRGSLAKVQAGIAAALEADLHPVKVNCVALRHTNADEVSEFAEWTRHVPVHVRFIEVMPMRWNLDELPNDARFSSLPGQFTRQQAPGEMLSDLQMRRQFIATEVLKQRIEEVHGPLEPTMILTNGPARTFRLPGARGTVGFISQISNDLCLRCNRLRLTADGYLRPCLMSDGELDLRTALRTGATDEEIANLFRHVVQHKPERHYLHEGQRVVGRGMSQVGG